MGWALGIVTCGVIPLIAIVFLVGAGILRGAVLLANKCLGASASGSDSEEDDEWTGYRRKERQTKAIPEPGLGKAMVSVFLLSLLGFLAGFPVRFVFDLDPFGPDQPGDNTPLLLAQALGLIIGFPFSALLLSAILPTTFGRACLVVLFHYLILLAIALVLGMLGLVLFF